MIVDVDHNAKGPQVIISRTDERLLMKLFEMEVPEIYDGTVIIERAVRDPGDRAKVAVRSKDRDVDPVGACVGMKGSRVQSIIRELRGEKIDIVQYSDDVNTFVANSLNPAKINRVQFVDTENKILEVVVDDEQLSLAIGKKGQNVRLASRLSGWRIDIKSEQEKKREVEAEMERMARDAREMERLDGVTPKTLEKILEAGYRSVDQILEAGLDGVAQLPGIGPKTAEKVLAAAQEMFDSRPAREEAEQQERDRVEAEEAEARAREAALLEPQHEDGAIDGNDVEAASEAPGEDICPEESRASMGETAGEDDPAGNRPASDESADTRQADRGEDK